MPSLIAIDPSGDPNGHTGIVSLWWDDDSPAELLHSWAVPGGVDNFATWWEDVVTDDVAAVVCEKFVNRNIPGADLSPLRVQGAVEYVCWASGLPLTLQPAAGKNTAVPDTALRRVGMYDFPGRDHHHDRREAARHGLVWLKNKKHMPTLLALFRD